MKVDQTEATTKIAAARTTSPAAPLTQPPAAPTIVPKEKKPAKFDYCWAI